MKVLITGSSGQIGTNVGLALLERGDTVHGIDKRANTWTDLIETTLLDLSKCAPTDLPSKTKYDVVLHLAAYAKVFELVEHPERAMENMTMLFNTLDYCRRTKTPIIFGSSREVYGDIHRWITVEQEADFIVAESPYSATKIGSEALIYSYGECYGLPHLVFRFSNVYGRFDSDAERMERVIPLFIQRIANDQPIIVYGKNKTLDFTYVDDCVQGVVKGIDALAGGKIKSATINLACGQGSSLFDLVNMIGMCLNKTPDATYEPSRRGEVTRYVADISVARELLDYEPTLPLSGGLPKAIAWQRQVGLLKT
ncbi:MAG: NAD-dependent epimerase/dehydratase family protein [Planctomycetes bacterium]|nr:NAD-dependent epimerase/dehydratase family protein [Planctomycetota bacterium]